jgi:hypothetical protein
MGHFKKVTLGLLSVSLGLFFTSCNKMSLSNLVNFDSSQAFTQSVTSARLNFCTTPGTQLKSNIKFIFLVDHSGSNFQDYDSNGNPLPGTDPTGVRRFDPLISFVSTLPQDASNPNVYYFALVDFNGQATNATNGFVSGVGNFVNVLLADRDKLGPYQPDDEGWTDYVGAEGVANQIITADITAAKSAGNLTSTAYICFHVTDGVPLMQYGLESAVNVLGGIAAIEALQPANKEFVDTIQYNTAYYFNQADPNAITLLTEMAATGQGHFYEFSAGQAINYQDFALPARQIRHLFSDIYVLNLNTAWNSSAVLSLSSAGDGVPDSLKPATAAQKDEDGNGVSDLAELRASNQVCQDASCSPLAAADYNFKCASFLTSATTGLNRFLSVFPGINECESFILGGDPLTWHSTLAPIPDTLLLRTGLSMAVGSNSANLDPFSENMPNYLKIKLNAPVNFATKDVPNLTLQSYNVAMTSTNSTQDCYQVSVSNIPTITSDATGNAIVNNIGVWEVETDAIIGSNYYLRTGSLPATGSSVSFGDKDLK